VGTYIRQKSETVARLLLRFFNRYHRAFQKPGQFEEALEQYMHEVMTLSPEERNKELKLAEIERALTTQVSHIRDGEGHQ